MKPLLLTSMLLTLAGPLACSAAAPSVYRAAHPAPLRAAVFAQPGFPYYNTSFLSPKTLAIDLDRAGVPATLLDAAALADPHRFNASRYAVLVMPYGNDYPREAFQNLQAFHRAGGCLVLTGVPFTHALIVAPAGWSASPDWGSQVHVESAAHTGASSLYLRHSSGDWVGASSERLPVRPGDRVTVSAWVQNVQGRDGGDDWVFVRFYDRGGQFLTQKGAGIPASARWTRVGVEAAAPANAAAFDVAPQIRTPGRAVRVDDVTVEINGKPVPLTNPGFELRGTDWIDLGHSGTPALFGSAGIGVGGFTSGPRGVVTTAPGDPLQLKALAMDWGHGPDSQVLDTTSLPASDRVVPILQAGGHPVASLVLHKGDGYPGAIDVWTGSAYGDQAQLAARGVVAVLTMKGILNGRQEAGAFHALNVLPRPPVYANLTLPAPPRPYPTFQPRMPPPARRLFVANLERIPFDERLLLVSLQGIVNRRQPRIYLVFGGDDRFWLNQMEQKGQTGAPIPVADPLSLVQRFRTEIAGAVVSDPKVYLSPCVAVDLAGLDNLVIATPALAQQLKLPIRVDLRGRFADDAAALRFAREKLLARMNPYLAICLDPTLLDNGAIDQIIAARGSCFWVTGPRAQGKPGADMAAERSELQATLARMPLNAVIRGFWWHGDGQGLDEGPGVSLGSQFGKVTVVSDLVSNFSVLSGVPTPPFHQKPQAPPPALDRSKVYLAITMSDGDNLCTWRGYFRRYFEDPLHGTFPVGWGMGPTLSDVAPTIAHWYYDHATPNDEFLCDVSGVGYIYPPDYATALKDRPAALKQFYQWTQRYMQRMDMHTIRLMNVRTQDIPTVGKDLPAVPFLMPDYGFAGERSYRQITYTLPTGQAVFRAIMSGSGPQNLANQIRTRVGSVRPAFVNAFVWNWGSSLGDLKQMLNLLGPDYVAVTPSQLDALYVQSRKSSGS